jgi:hypothetical protein
MAQAQAGKPRTGRGVGDVAEIAPVEVEQAGFERNRFGTVAHVAVDPDRIGKIQAGRQKVDGEIRTMRQHGRAAGHRTDPAIGIIAEPRKGWRQRGRAVLVGAGCAAARLGQQRPVWFRSSQRAGPKDSAIAPSPARNPAPPHQAGASMMRSTKGRDTERKSDRRQPGCGRPPPADHRDGDKGPSPRGCLGQDRCRSVSGTLPSPVFQPQSRPRADGQDGPRLSQHDEGRR